MMGWCATQCDRLRKWAPVMEDDFFMLT